MLLEDHRAPRPGEIMRLPNLASTFREVAQKGKPVCRLRELSAVQPFPFNERSFAMYLVARLHISSVIKMCNSFARNGL